MPSEVLGNWKHDLRKSLKALEERSQFRTLAETQGVNFCSNDYLGLAHHPALRETLARTVNVAKRVGGTGSRLLSGHTRDWMHLEEHFAGFAGTESALYFTSGYSANVGLLSSLVSKDDVVFSDALNHASLIDGMRLSGARKVIYPHLDLQVLEAALREETGAPWRKVIVTESVFSMDGDVAPIRKMADLAEKYGAALIVDEAHATGVFGPHGSGICAEAEVVPSMLAVIHTCGKALGCAGAFVCGPNVLKEFLINNARTFIFSTALPPYFAQQINTALNLSLEMEEERRTLLENSRSLIKALQSAGFNTSGSDSQIVPIVIGGNEEALDAAHSLQREGFRHSRDPAAHRAGKSGATAAFPDRAHSPGGVVATGRLSVRLAKNQKSGRASQTSMRRHFFITGTDTGVGKTTLSALLCAALDAVYWKPIQTGTLEGTDRVTVMRLAGIGTDRTLDEVYKFVPPVSPDLAARWAGVEIDLNRISLPTSLMNDWLIAEGAGGVLVPINSKQFMLDLMVKFKIPVILAARSGLGTINHTLLTLAALHAAELPVHGVVLIGDQNRENRETIEKFGHVRVIGEIPRLPNLHRTALMQVFLNHFDRSAFAQ